MTATRKPPHSDAPDAGVIEEARARQRRHRGMLLASVVLALTIAGLLFGFAGGGHGGGVHPRGSTALSGGPLAKGRHASSTACLSRTRRLHGRPNRSLLAILGVLRRPANAVDALAQDAGGGITRDLFVNYIRRTRAIAGSDYYLFPTISGGCGIEPERQGISTLETNIDLGHGLIGSAGGGGGTAADIEQGRTVESGPPGSATSTTVTMIVPDGVSTVTLHFPAGRASGYSPKISPAATITAPVVNNELVTRVPRTTWPELGHGITMLWRAPGGRVLRRFNRL